MAHRRPRPARQTGLVLFLQAAAVVAVAAGARQCAAQSFAQVVAGMQGTSANPAAGGAWGSRAPAAPSGYAPRGALPQLNRPQRPTAWAGPAACAASVVGSPACHTPTECSVPCCPAGAASGGPPTDRRVSPALLKLATFNTEWLFDGMGEEPQASPYYLSKFPSAAAAAAAAQAHLQAVCATLKRVNPDVAVLQEVENCGRAKALAACLNQGASGGGGGYNGYLMQGTDSATGQDVAMVTRVDPVAPLARSDARAATPVPGSRCGRQLPKRQTSLSKQLIGYFNWGPKLPKVAVVGVHLIAYPKQPDRCSQREGQARIVQGIVRDLLSKGYEVAVLGDFNDFDGSAPDVAGSAPASRVLELVKDPDGDGVPDLRSVAELIPKAQRYSNWHDVNSNGVVDSCGCGLDLKQVSCHVACRGACTACERSTIDHILLSKGLFSRAKAAGVDQAHDPAKVSDHWPIWVAIDTT